MRKFRVFFLLLVLLPTSVSAWDGENLTEVLGVRITPDTKLADIQKRLGQAQVLETGDGGEYKAAVCYYSPRCQAQVEFWSSDLGGPQHDLIGFTLSRNSSPSAVCSILTIDDCASLKVPRGVKLGMTLDEYKDAVGGDVVQEGSFYQKAFERRQPMTETERSSYPDLSQDELYWDIVIFVRGAFRSGMLDILEVSKTVTN